MKNTLKFDDFLKEELKDPTIKKAFDDEELYASVAIQIAKMREKYGLTQKELAKKLRTSQQVISRLENSGSRCTLLTLQRIANTFHKKLQVKFI